MGCCVSKGPAKVDPYVSHVNLVQEELHVQNYNKCDETPEATPTDNVTGRCSVSDDQQKNNEETTRVNRGDIQVSSQIKQDLPPLGRTESWTPKSVAFDIHFNEMDINSQSTAKKFPRRLKKLEGVSQLTAQQLRTKQELAELNRSKELQRKTETSSKHNRDLFQAREDERLKNAHIQMEQKFLARERNRDNHVTEVINKQRQREQKAKKVREKSCVELEGSVVHVDETYSSADSSPDESWGAEVEEQDVRKTGDENQDESSTDEFFDTSGRTHLNKIPDSTAAGFLLL